MRENRTLSQDCTEGKVCVAQKTGPWGTSFLEGPRGPFAAGWEGSRCQPPVPPQASWGWGGSLCACRSPRQRSAYRGPFVPGASSARRAAGNEAHSPHPLPRPLAIRQCHSRLARRPLAHRASTGNCLPVLISEMGSWSRASLQGEVGSLGPASQGLAIDHELGSSCQSSLQAAKQWPPRAFLGWYGEWSPVLTEVF